MTTRFCRTEKGVPQSGINTAGRNTTKGGIHKKKKDNIAHTESMGLLSKSQKDKMMKEKKENAEMKLKLKRKMRLVIVCLCLLRLVLI
jgi:hypothetical protein